VTRISKRHHATFAERMLVEKVDRAVPNISKRSIASLSRAEGQAIAKAAAAASVADLTARLHRLEAQGIAKRGGGTAPPQLVQAVGHLIERLDRLEKGSSVAPLGKHGSDTFSGLLS
jgi:HPt (histidine-containing phosphotransfer) domain-containing protein